MGFDNLFLFHRIYTQVLFTFFGRTDPEFVVKIRNSCADRIGDGNLKIFCYHEEAHYYQSLRIPLTNDQTEFDQQVLTLAKILVDSLNENELEKTIIVEKGDKSITKFEKFLESHGLVDCDKHVSFLRNLWVLRSSGTAHRKSKNFEKVYKRQLTANTVFYILGNSQKSGRKFIGVS